MPETVGMLNLKIAQLERRLHIFSQRRPLGENYPNYQNYLTRICEQLQMQLDELFHRRQELLQLETEKGPYEF
jgi:hypothetical protein